jgi:hypothetical protein
MGGILEMAYFVTLKQDGQPIQVNLDRGQLSIGGTEC